MINTNSTRHWMVDTVKKSQATISLTWLLKNAFQVGDGGLRSRGRYFSTVDLATVIPSFRSSPTMRGEPRVGLLRHMSRIKSRTSLEGNVSKVEMTIFTLAVQRHIDSQTTRSQCRASASISKSRSSDAPGV